MEEVPKIKNTIQRDGIYYFKKRIPEDIVKTFADEHKTGEFITKSLGTGDYKSAIVLRDQMLADKNRLFEEHRIKQNKRKLEPYIIENDELSTYSDSQLLIPILNWLDYSQNSHSEAIEADHAPKIGEPLNWHIEDMLAEQSHYEEAYQLKDNRYGIQIAEKELKRQNIAYNKKSKNFRKVARLFAEALIEDMERSIIRQKNKPVPEYINPKFKPDVKISISLGNLIKEYINNNSHNWREHTLGTNVTSLELIEDFFKTDTPVHEINRQQCRKFQKLVFDLPLYVRRDYPKEKYTLEKAIQLAKAKGQKNIAIKTANGRIQMLETLMQYAIDEHYIEMHPAKGLQKTDNEKKKNKRYSFNDEQLKAIFSSPLYTGCKDGNSGYKKIGNVIPKNSDRFWVPLLALWTGMRAGECVQLEVRDIGKEENVDVIYIRESDDPNEDGNKQAYEKRVKNKNSIRFVPVPPELIKIGFLDFVLNQKHKKEIRLFPNVKPYKGSNSAYFTKWFNEGFLNEYIPERKKHKETFHSFRHTYRDAMRRADIPDQIVSALGGWTGDMGTQDKYGSKDSAQVLYEYISKITYPKLDLSHLYLDNS